MRDKVAVIGMARTTLSQVPWLDESWEKWVINESHDVPEINDQYDHIDRWFQLHPYWDFSRKAGVYNAAHLDWLKQEHPFSIWMQKKFKSIPSSIAFPFKKVFKWTPGILKDYFTCTFTYQIAFALYTWDNSHAGPVGRSLGLWGIEMGSETEIIEAQKSALESWIAYADGLGVNVVLPDSCKLFRGPRHPRKYAYEQVPEVHRHHLEIRIARKNQEYHIIAGELNEMIAVLLEMTRDEEDPEYLAQYWAIKAKRKELHMIEGGIEAIRDVQSEVDDTIYGFENPAEDL